MTVYVLIIYKMLFMIVLHFLLFNKIVLPIDIKVLELTAEFFENYTSRPEGVIVIMFYAPWCPQCQEIKPEIFKAAKSMASLNTQNVFAMVNCEDTKNTDLCHQQNIDGYPTIKAFGPQNKIIIFNGVPNEENLLKFIENPEKFAESVESTDSESDEDHIPDTPLNHTTYLNFDNFNSTLSQVKHALVFFYAPWCPHCQDSKPHIDKASEKLKSKYHGIYAVNCEDKNSKLLCPLHGIDGYPTLKYFHYGELFAEYEDELTTEGYLKYMSKPPTEKVKYTPKETNEEDDKTEEKMTFVKYLTKDTFQKSIEEPDKQTMVMFYIPGCPHCQSAISVFDSAAKTISESNSNHILAAVNCDDKDNEKLCEKEGIEGFPTFHHYFEGKRKNIYNEMPLSEEKLFKYFSSTSKDEL